VKAKANADTFVRAICLKQSPGPMSRLFTVSARGRGLTPHPLRKSMWWLRVTKPNCARWILGPCAKRPIAWTWRSGRTSVVVGLKCLSFLYRAYTLRWWRIYCWVRQTKRHH